MSQEHQEISDLPGAKRSPKTQETTNNVVYLITVEDLLPKKKIRYFVCVKYDGLNHGIFFRGAEISATQINQINQLSAYEDAIKAANKNKSSIMELTYPWHRVVNIKNMAYRNKV